MKYSIVVSTYDNLTNQYKNEQEVDLKGVENTLHSIDHYTSELSYQTIKKMIQELPNIRPFTTIAIKGEYRSTTRYFSLITNNKTLHHCTSDIIKQSFPESRYPFSYAINPYNPSFIQELEKFKTLIQQKKLKELRIIFSQNKHLTAQITRYINIDYQNDFYNEKQQDYQTILREFSRYKNFRIWIQHNQKYSLTQKKPSAYNDPFALANYPKSLSPAACAAQKYNTESWQIYDREEFLTKEDMEQTGLIDDPKTDPYLSFKIKKLHPRYPASKRKDKQN